MPREPLRQFLQHLRQVVGVSNVRALDDAQLLERFISQRDGAAFEVLVWRHGGLVLDVCGRLLHHPQDIEDAFQATFLVLVRQAKGIRKRAALASWLYKVAYNVALRARRAVTRPNVPPSVTAELPTAEANGRDDGCELKPVLDDEISQLPEKYRAAVVLCYLQGLTTADAARQLGCAQGTIHSRLAWARARLRSRLLRRGVTMSVPALASALSSHPTTAAAPAGLVAATIRLALLTALGKAAAGAGRLSVAALVEGVVRTMFLAKLRAVTAGLLLISALGLGAGLIGPPALADKPASPQAPSLVPGKPDTIELSAEVVAHLGLQTTDVKTRSDLTTPFLRLSGVLTYHPDRLIDVRSRVVGEIVEIGQPTDIGFFPPSRALIVPAPSQTPAKGGSGSNSTPDPMQRLATTYYWKASRAASQGETAPYASIGLGTATMSSYLRPFALGDKVSKGQILAVVYSKNLGMKQVEFLDAVARERLDRSQFERMEAAFKEAAISENTFRAAEREAKLRANQVLTARRTLVLWKLSPEEIDALAREAEPSAGKKRRPDMEKKLGQIAIRSPMDGVVVERNLAVGDIVQPAAVLFRIADLSRLQVVANASARDLAALHALTPSERRWTIRPAGTADAPAAQGEITDVFGGERPSRPRGSGKRNDSFWIDEATQNQYFAGLRPSEMVPAHLDDPNIRPRLPSETLPPIVLPFDPSATQPAVVDPLDPTEWELDLWPAVVEQPFKRGANADPREAQYRIYKSLIAQAREARQKEARTQTGVVTGWVDNHAGRLVAGQFITASIPLPAVRREAAVSTSALVQEAGKEYVIVQPDRGKLQYTPRQVLVLRRDRQMAHIRMQPTPAEMKQGFQALLPGERVVIRSAVEVKGMVEELRAR
jgi:RNA polymerase sigma factor (sigma-70 family)